MTELNPAPDEHLDAGGAAGIALLVVADCVCVQRDAARLRAALGHQPLGQDVIRGGIGATGMKR